MQTRETMVAVALLGISAGPCAAATAHKGAIVMGTVLQVTVVADGDERARDLVESAFEVAEHWDDVLTTWRNDGELRHLNAASGRGRLPISPDLHTALGRMVALSATTAGAFDPAVGPMVETLRNGQALPAPLRSNQMRRYRIASALTLSPGHAELLAGAALDAGGIGKGVALDAIADHLRSGGAAAAFLDFGGSSQLAFGTAEDGEPWWVALAGDAPSTVLGLVALRDGSLSTSRATASGNRAGSIVDPRDLRVVEPPRLATVVATDATTAEAWSTALIVLGVEGVARARGAGVHALVEIAGEVTRTEDFPLEQ